MFKKIPEALRALLNRMKKTPKQQPDQQECKHQWSSWERGYGVGESCTYYSVGVFADEIEHYPVKYRERFCNICGQRQYLEKRLGQSYRWVEK